MAIAQQQLSDILDASVEAMAAFCARRIATDKLEDARDALLQAEESRQVTYAHRFGGHVLFFLFLSLSSFRAE